MPAASKLFAGYRALGFVSNHVPLTVRYHQKHKENYIVTCVGKSFHTYNCSKLGIVSVSDSLPDEINVTAVDRDLVFTACRNVIYAFSRGKQVVHTYVGHEADVHLLLPFGQHLISVDTDSQLIIWDIRSEGQYTELQFSNRAFQVTAVAHPSTYLNKILLGSKQGELQLWNVKQNKLVYTFHGWGHSVTVIQQAPAVDVVAIGMASGQIVLHNLKFDETITKFMQDWGPVTAISFRTDGHPVMASGSAAGHIALWDLEERKLKSQMRSTHTTAVTGMQCLPNEPLMVTSAADNTLKMWIFDMPDGGGRLLRERSGHSAPPTKLRHYGNNGHNILSASQDGTLRSFSTLHDKHNKSLGRGSYNKAATKKRTLKHDQHQMPYIVDFATESCRQSDWDNIVACHRGLNTATTWSYIRSTMGQHKLQQDRFIDEPELYTNTVTQCVDITSCGNFCVVGHSSGHVDVYNLQSGICRGSYGQPKAHECCVQGVAVDGLNQVTITAGRDGCLKFWKFKQKTLLDTCTLDSTISQILLHRESSMLAVARDDFQVNILDMDTRRVVRKFTGHDNRITDMTFSSDARWLVTASMDCSLRVWDLPTGRLIDCFLLYCAIISFSLSPISDFLTTSNQDDKYVTKIKLYRQVDRLFPGRLCHRLSVTVTDLKFLTKAYHDDKMLIDCFLVDCAITSLSLSPTSDFLTTAHQDDVGVYLWSNTTLFDHVPLRALPEGYEPQMVEMPTTRRKSPGVLEAKEEDEEEEFVRSEFKSVEQISHELITLSLLPNSRWQNLLNIDLIKQRNKPKQPPKLPKAAPFFLPTVAGLELKFAQEEGEKKEQTRAVTPGSLMPLCTLGKLLQKGAETDNYTAVLDYLKSLGPSAVDVEIRSLGPEMGGSVEVLGHFLQCVGAGLETNKNFEIIQAYLGLFVKVHKDLLSSTPALVEQLKQVSEIQTESWRNVQDLFNQTLCLVNYLRTATL